MAPFAAIRARYPAITSLEVKTEASGDGFEAHVEVLLPQHQVIVNAAAPDAARAVAEAAARTERALERLAARDPSIAPPARAFAHA